MPVTINVLPHEIDTKFFLCGSSLENETEEAVACDIIVMMRRKGDRREKFTREDYARNCDRLPDDEHFAVLQEFVSRGLLSFKNGYYEVEDEFVNILEPFQWG